MNPARALIAAFVLSSSLLVTRAAETGAPRNVLIFLADDYGVMDVGANNPKTFYETPNLDRFAAQGVRFTQAYSANPVCSPTRYSIQTGKYPTRAGLTDFLPGARIERFEGAPLTREMALEETTLTEALKSAGYRTGFIGKWHLGEQEKYWPEGQGYDVNIAGCNRGSPASYFSPYKNPRLPDGPEGEHLTARLADEGVALLDKFRAEGKPFLLSFCFYD